MTPSAALDLATLTHAKREPFSLLFRAATRELQLPQQIHPLEHPQLGRLELFMVPLGPDATGMRYEAIFA